ncbi:MAG: hypothetical protein EH225_02125 [Calditrichaeota bacterium]|nr:hypothetical protein [Calditrichota bacterium]RQW07270.1 MAG: hypothetical protein EH225_02125 [Calditrichota bacterium]
MKKFINGQGASRIVERMGKEFVVVKNPDYVHPSHDIYPLAPRITRPLKRIDAIVMDMDGTTTTTEALCIHSLEHMVRQITDRMSHRVWGGLEPAEDYPHIIGNSTTKHVEYLIKKYQPYIKIENLQKSYLEAVAWTLKFGRDRKRQEEVIGNLHYFGLKSLLEDKRFRHYLSLERIESLDFIELTRYVISEFAGAIKPRSVTDLVRFGIDIYYHRYHEILNVLLSGRGDALSKELFGKAGIRLIEPMKGVAVFLALIKGLLGKDAEKLLPVLLDNAAEMDPDFSRKLIQFSKKHRLSQLGTAFMKKPVKTAVVTSSISFEARVVLTEVFRILREQISRWPLSVSKKNKILKKFESYENYYDAVISASDSSEIRLKPHRDLYSIALHRLGIGREHFPNVIGFEDSESGTIAIRAAGIGMCIAVPFSETQHHDFSAASYVVKGALPETLLRYHLFLDVK